MVAKSRSSLLIEKFPGREVGYLRMAVEEHPYVGYIEIGKKMGGSQEPVGKVNGCSCDPPLGAPTEKYIVLLLRESRPISLGRLSLVRSATKARLGGAFLCQSSESSRTMAHWRGKLRPWSGDRLTCGADGAFS
jgi:hypothetical protein